MEKKDLIYEYIKEVIYNKGLPPTIREIGKHFDISSTNGVRYFLNCLEQEGLIMRQSRTARGIRIIEKQPQVRGKTIPVLGRVPAGKPTISEEFVDDTILIDERIARGERIFAVKVNGDSMIGAGIQDGDIAVVKENQIPQSGDIVVALIDDEVTLKRYLKKGSSIILKPENVNYTEINLSTIKHIQPKIIGKVLSIIRKF